MPAESNIQSGGLALVASKLTTAASNLLGYPVPFSPNTPTVPAAAVEYMSGELHYTFVGWPGVANIMSDSLTGSLTVTQPIEYFPVAINGKLTQSFLQDYYYRLHITPNVLDAGFLLGNRSYPIEVWNSNFTSVTLDTILETNTLGMEMTGPSLPSTHMPLQAKTYTVILNIIGPPSIDAVYTYSSGAVAIPLTIIGSRVITLPNLPKAAHIEGREYLTDVIKSRNNESRVSNRATPRETQSLEYIFKTSEEFSIAKSLLKAVGHYTLGIPAWENVVPVKSVPMGTVTVLLPTDRKEFAEGKFCVIWQSVTKYESVQILSLTSSSISFNSPVVNSYTNCYIAPLTMGFATSGFTFTRGAPNRAKMKAEYLITDVFFQAIWANPIMYKSLPVVDSLSAALGNMEEKLFRDMEIFDPGFGDFTSYVAENTTKFNQTLTFTATTKEGKYAIKRQMDYLMGKFGLFYIPTGNQDLTALGTVAVNGTTLVVKFAGWSLYGVTPVKVVGSVTKYLTVLSAISYSPGEETLLFEETVPEGIIDITSIQAVHKCRLNSDRIEFNHISREAMQMTVPIIEVN